MWAKGLAVYAVFDAQEALDLLGGGFAPDHLVSDIVTRGPQDGVAFVRQVRAQHPGVTAVLVTGHSGVAERVRDEGLTVLRMPHPPRCSRRSRSPEHRPTCKRIASELQATWLVARPKFAGLRGVHLRLVPPSPVTPPIAVH